MPNPDQPPEMESSYLIDAENVAEMARLAKQARMLSEHFGLVPATLDFAQRQVILDVGCGPGEWVLEMARRYPASRVTGIDISERMIAYAQYYAREHAILNTQFQLMDARQPLALPALSFDFVHTRLVASFLSTTTWPQLVGACFQLLRPGGIFCSTEFEGLGITTSPALMEYNRLVAQAGRQAGQCFTPTGDQIGITAVQHRLLQQAGFQSIQQQAYALNYSSGMPAHDAMCDNCIIFLKLVQPFLVRSGVATSQHIDVLHGQLSEEMAAEDFSAVAFFQRLWGEKPLST